MESEAPRFEYDVFLNFRGADTRQGLASVLYDHMVRAGIRVFKDDGVLKAGDKIETILGAINKSELCVPIFSENFASSKWCLEEVRRMVHLEKVICPIFYKVSIEDVKLKTGPYVGQMEKLEANKEKIEEWKDALKSATGFIGAILVHQSYPDFCKNFVTDVLKKLGPRDQSVVNDLIGVDNQLEDFMQLWCIQSADVRYIGIHGMGGIGKTTLAEVIFHKFSANFDGCSFIENIRERSLAANGLSNLEKELKGNLGFTRETEVDLSRHPNQIFYRKKVLLVLDDADKSEQIEKLVKNRSSFGPGSRIVVTTRDIRVLTKCRKLKEEEVFPFEMGMLESHHALRLFSSYAFKKDNPPSDFRSLSEEVVSTAGGLPLALIVLGSSLCNEDDKEVWKDVTERSKKIPFNKVKNRLKISYDKLAGDQKQIFLDIACLSVCMEKSKVFSMWEASKFYPTWGLAVLQSLSLIKMKDNNEIWMHGQLRELGRDIVRGESDLPSERSRLWEHDEALEVLKSKREKKNVQAISLDKSSEVTLTREQLDTLENLRFLQLGQAKFDRDLDNVLPKLKWLSWRPGSEFEAINFSLPNLVSLDLSDSSITENWRGWSLIQGAKNLKDLYLTSCSKLTRTPEFPKHMILEALALQDCRSLATVDSLGRLGKLQRLTLSYCSTLKTLPPSVGNIRSLTKLHLSRTAITELPDSIRSLENLRELRVDGCNLEKLPWWLCHLGNLEVLYAGSNQLLEELPEDIGRLVSLRVLDLEGSTICKLPSSINQLSLLKTLNLERCYQLQELPELPTSLSELSIRSKLLKKLSDLSSMDNLVKLCIVVERSEEVETSNLNLIEKLIKLEVVYLRLQLQKSAPLPIDFSRLTRLRDLSLPCQNLKDPLQLPSSLSVLILEHVDSETNLPCLSNLVNLRVLVLVDWSRSNGYEILRIEDLHSLKEFTVLRCSCNVMDGLHLPQNLITLNVWDCESLTKLPDLAGLKDLSFLELFGCKKLSEIPGLGKSKFLRSLKIKDCDSLGRLENLSELEILEELVISDCEELDCIDGIDGIDSWELQMYHYMHCMEDLFGGDPVYEYGRYAVEDERRNQTNEVEDETDEVEDEQPIKKRKNEEKDKDKDEDEWLRLRL